MQFYLNTWPLEAELLYINFISKTPDDIRKILILFRLCRDQLEVSLVRALYQRRKGRDLFDLWIGLKEGKANAAKVVKIFREYMKAEGHGISAGDYEKNLEAKMKHVDFVEDITSLLPADINYDIKDAFSMIIQQIVSRIDSELP
jgi:hypothetical protein